MNDKNKCRDFAVCDFHDNCKPDKECFVSQKTPRSKRPVERLVVLRFK